MYIQVGKFRLSKLGFFNCLYLFMSLPLLHTSIYIRLVLLLVLIQGSIWLQLDVFWCQQQFRTLLYLKCLRLLHSPPQLFLHSCCIESTQLYHSPTQLLSNVHDCTTLFCWCYRMYTIVPLSSDDAVEFTRLYYSPPLMLLNVHDCTTLLSNVHNCTTLLRWCCWIYTVCTTLFRWCCRMYTIVPLSSAAAIECARLYRSPPQLLSLK